MMNAIGEAYDVTKINIGYKTRRENILYLIKKKYWSGRPNNFNINKSEFIKLLNKTNTFCIIAQKCLLFWDK